MPCTVALVPMLVFASALMHCPDCATARAARLLVFGDAFWVHVWWTALPFGVVALVVRAIARQIDRADRADRADRELAP